MEGSFELTAEHRSILLQVALRSIQYALDQRTSFKVKPGDYPEMLQTLRAAFVTLHVDKCLRGCIGTLDAYAPLVETVAKYAFSSAFHDQRFSPICRHELSRLQITISVLTLPKPVDCLSEENVIRLLRPGLDGVLLEDGACRSTLLPSVWEDIPEPREFLRRLKIKAGLPPDYWSNSIRLCLYETVCFSNMS